MLLLKASDITFLRYANYKVQNSSFESQMLIAILLTYVQLQKVRNLKNIRKRVKERPQKHLPIEKYRESFLNKNKWAHWPGSIRQTAQSMHKQPGTKMRSESPHF